MFIVVLYTYRVCNIFNVEFEESSESKINTSTFVLI